MYPNAVTVNSRQTLFLAAALGALLGFALRGFLDFVEGLAHIALLLWRHAQ